MSYTSDLLDRVAADTSVMLGPTYRVAPGTYTELSDPLLGPLYVCAVEVPTGAQGVGYVGGRVCGCDHAGRSVRDALGRCSAGSDQPRARSRLTTSNEGGNRP